MNDLEILGKLHKDKTKNDIYFCKFDPDLVDTEKGMELYEECRDKFPESGEICAIVVESRDGMKQDERVVGIMVDTPDGVKGFMITGYEDLSPYLKKPE